MWQKSVYLNVYKQHKRATKDAWNYEQKSSGRPESGTLVANHPAYKKGNVHFFTDSLTQLFSSDSREDWVINFGVEIDIEALTPTKTRVYEILHPSRQGGADVKNIVV